MQAALDKNYFEIFGLPESFRLDLADITQRYRQLQQQLHPDRFASASDQERRLSVQTVAMVNEAFQTLKDPVRRGRYLLQLRDVDTGEESDTSMDPAFLMEQMELRESLGEARQDEHPLVRLGTLETDVREALESRIARLETCFSDGAEEDLKTARNIVRELQFLQKMQTEIEQLEEDFL